MNTDSPAAAAPQPMDWIGQLTRLVRALKRSDIRSVPALIGKLVQDPVAASMALRLLYWLPRATRPGGWVYKSWRDWAAECNLSQAQVKRVHNQHLLEGVGFVRATFKANGCPTTHYRLDVEAFTGHLAQFLGVTPSQVHLWMQTDPEPTQAAVSTPSNGANRPGSMGANRPMEKAETAKSITESDSQKLSTDRQTESTDITVVVDQPDGMQTRYLRSKLLAMGIAPTRVDQVIQSYTNEQIEGALSLCQHSKATNPAGYLIRALEGNWQAVPLRSMYEPQDGRRYITGKYADIIKS